MSQQANGNQCHTPQCHHNNDPSFKLTRVADHTISGLDLRTRELREFASTLRFYADEQLLYLYWDKEEFEKYFHVNQGVFVGLTNYRIFKVEGSSVDSVELRNIASVNHQKNGMFHWVSEQTGQSTQQTSEIRTRICDDPSVQPSLL